MSPYDSLTALLSWEPTEEEIDYLSGYAIPALERAFNQPGQHLVVGPGHRARFDWTENVLTDKRLLKALLDPAMTCDVYTAGDDASHGRGTPRRIPLRTISGTEPVIEPKAPAESRLPKADQWVPAWMRPVRPGVDRNLAAANADAILGRLKNKCIVQLVRVGGGVVLAKWTPQNMPSASHVINALVENQDAIAVELDTETMRQAPVAGFVVAQ
jgi:hypothetical protein